MTSESAIPGESSPLPDVVALAKVVAKQRSELAHLQDQVATSAVLERAKGAVMALTGSPADAAYEELTRGAEAEGRSLIEECWVTLGSIRADDSGGGAGSSSPDGSGGAASPDPDPVPVPVPVPVPIFTGEPSSPDGNGDGEPAGPDGNGDGEPAGPDGNGDGEPAGPEGNGGAEPAGPDGTRPAGNSEVSRRIGEALLRVRTPQDLAVCLLDHLADAAGADAVMIYTAQPAGGWSSSGTPASATPSPRSGPRCRRSAVSRPWRPSGAISRSGWRTSSRTGGGTC